jgi:DNA-binding transcriptional LysR family regulator
MIVREAVEPQTVLAMISMGMGITLIADSYAQDAMAWCCLSSVGGANTG